MGQGPNALALPWPLRPGPSGPGPFLLGKNIFSENTHLSLQNACLLTVSGKVWASSGKPEATSCRKLCSCKSGAPHHVSLNPLSLYTLLSFRATTVHRILLRVYTGCSPPPAPAVYLWHWLPGSVMGARGGSGYIVGAECRRKPKGS